MTHTLIAERPEDAADIDSLLDRAFGPERHQKTSYRYRDGVAPVPGLSWVIRDGASLIGTIRYWPVLADGRVFLLLGPIAVDPTRQGEGIGAALIFQTLEFAVWAGHRLVVLVGEKSYYGRFGFRPTNGSGLVMPGEDPHRLLMLPLAFGAHPAGTITRADGMLPSLHTVAPRDTLSPDPSAQDGSGSADRGWYQTASG